MDCTSPPLDDVEIHFDGYETDHLSAFNTEGDHPLPANAGDIVVQPGESKKVWFIGLLGTKSRHPLFATVGNGDNSTRLSLPPP